MTPHPKFSNLTHCCTIAQVAFSLFIHFNWFAYLTIINVEMRLCKESSQEFIPERKPVSVSISRRVERHSRIIIFFKCLLAQRRKTHCQQLNANGLTHPKLHELLCVQRLPMKIFFALSSYRSDKEE